MTSSERLALIRPASGPESNSASRVTVSPSMAIGTSTKAGQNVPQAKPEFPVARRTPSERTSDTFAPMEESRYAGTTLPR